MATAPTSGQSARRLQTVYLDWTNTDGNILITPSDESRFVIKIGAAIEILRQHSQKQQAEQQFDLLLKRLAGWLDEHRTIWREAFLTAGEGVLRFIVVRKQVRYDDAATDSLSDLELDIARDTDLSLYQTKYNRSAVHIRRVPPIFPELGFHTGIWQRNSIT